MYAIRNALFAVVLTTAAGFSLWKGMTWPAVVSIVFLAALLYKNYTRDLVKSCLAFVDSARVAKFGQFELQADRGMQTDLSTIPLTDWMLKNLQPEEFGFLLLLYRNGRHPIVDLQARNSVRALKNRGWLEHDRPHFDESNEIWLTAQGRHTLESIIRGQKVISAEDKEVKRTHAK
jgi:hypothetical protein